MRRHSSLRWLVVQSVSVLAVHGCSSVDSGPPAATRLDSAGVEIVTMSVDADDVPAFAVLDTVPDLRIGSLAGAPEEEFGAIRDVIALRDGGLAVLDGMAGEVRIFDATGEFRVTFGGKGDAPGELRDPVTLAELPGDTIAVFDPSPRRLTRFTPDGSSHRITTLEDPEALMSDARILTDGRLIGQSRWTPPGGGTFPGTEPTLTRDTMVLALFEADGRVADTVDVVPGREEVVHVEISPGAVSVRKRPPAFARTNVFTVGAQGVWSSSNDRFELRLLRLGDGGLVRIVRAPGLERSATLDMAQSIYDSAQADADDAGQRSWLRTWFDLSPLPDVQPAFDILEVDDMDRLWVRAWSPSGEGGRWWVFEADGTLLGSVDVPSGTRITSVQCGSVLGVERDDFGVDYAVRYPVHGLDDC